MTAFIQAKPGGEVSLARGDLPLLRELAIVVQLKDGD
jgi:hypothetical protein